MLDTLSVTISPSLLVELFKSHLQSIRNNDDDDDDDDDDDNDDDDDDD